MVPPHKEKDEIRRENAMSPIRQVDKSSGEETLLLGLEKDTYSSASQVGAHSTQISDEVLKHEEINMPWPATFERSVKILARPIVGRELVMKATESMHILPPTKLPRNTALSYLNRGWRTPDPESRPILRERDDPDDFGGGGASGRGIFHRMGIRKIASLDWRLPRVSSSETQLKSIEESKPRYKKICSDISEKSEEADALQSCNESENVRSERLNESEDGSERNAVASEKATFTQCIFNMANTLMGIGILSLPFVFKVAGWLGGSFTLVTFGFVSWRTSILIGRELNGDPRQSHVFKKNASHESALSQTKYPSTRLRKPLNSFPAIAREAFGQQGTVVLSTVMYFELFSCLAAFLVSMGDHLHSLFPLVSQTRHMVLVSALLMVPTVLCKTPRLLSYLSAVGTFTTVTVVLSVMVAAVFEGNIAPKMAEQNEQELPSNETVPPYHVAWITAGLPIGYGLVAFCLAGHAIVPTIYTSMACPQDFEKMISYSYVLVLGCCITVAASGYYMFGSTVSDQVTISLEEAPIDAGIAMKVLTWLMITTLFSKCTLYLFPLALGVEEIIAPCVPNDQVMENSYTGIKFAIIALALLVGIFFPSFSFLCSLVGLVFAIIVSVIFPAAAHLKLFGPHLDKWEKVVDWVFIVGGMIVGFVGTVATTMGV